VSLNPIPHTAWFNVGTNLWATDGAVLVRKDCPQHPDPQQGAGDAPFHYAQPDDWRHVAAVLANCQHAATTHLPTLERLLGFDARFGGLLKWAHDDPAVNVTLCRVHGIDGLTEPARCVISGPTGTVAVVAPVVCISSVHDVDWTGAAMPLVWAARAREKMVEDSP